MARREFFSSPKIEKDFPRNSTHNLEFDDGVKQSSTVVCLEHALMTNSASLAEVYISNSQHPENEMQTSLTQSIHHVTHFFEHPVDLSASVSLFQDGNHGKNCSLEADDQNPRISEEWVQSKPVKGGVSGEAQLIGYSDIEACHVICMRPDENKNCMLNVAAESPPSILEGDEQQWISTATRAQKTKEHDDSNENAHAYDHNVLHVLLQDSFSPPENTESKSFDKMTLLLPDENFQSMSSMNVIDGVTQNSQDRITFSQSAIGSDSVTDCCSSALVQSRTFTGSNSCSHHAENKDFYPNGASSSYNPNYPDPMDPDDRMLKGTNLLHACKILEQLNEADIDAMTIASGKTTQVCDPIGSCDPLLQGRKHLDEFSTGKVTLKPLSTADIDAMTIVSGKTTQVCDPIGSCDPLLQGRKLLDEFSTGKVTWKQLSIADIDAMTIALGKTKLKGVRSKPDKLLNLQTIMRSMMKLDEPCAAHVAPVLQSSHLQQTSEMGSFSEIERVQRKFGTKPIAKMLADRIAQYPYDVDDMFIRLQVMHMLAVTEGSLKKPSTLSRTLHELSVHPNENRSKLESKLDQFAFLIENSMKPIHQTLAASSSPSSPKKKKSRILSHPTNSKTRDGT